MNNGNSHKIEIAAEKLYKLTQAVNRDSAKSQGFYDGRFSPRTEPDKKRTQYLRLRREKHALKSH
jgi:hypothetical protein